MAITRDILIPLDGHFALVDQDGRSVSDRDFRGSPMLIYFGYTACPDACPLDAQTISAAADVLDKRGERVTPIFITVDPERDTPVRLKTLFRDFSSSVRRSHRTCGRDSSRHGGLWRRGRPGEREAVGKL